MLRIGLGTDIHRLEKGRKLILGGVEIPHSSGLLGHSDADCLLHAIGDALLGACALGDLGTFFPGDEKNSNRPSREILTEICLKVWAKGYRVINVDTVIQAQEPKLASFREKMMENIAALLNIDKPAVGIKFSTNDELGTIGRKEGIAAQAIVLLEKKNL